MCAGQEVVVIALGGTILGRGKRGCEGYVSGAMGVESLTKELCVMLGLKRAELEQRLGAKITLLSLASIDSAEIDSRILLELARAVQKALQNKRVCGVVVLQGTDTLEESSFFLHLLSTSKKPIVFSAAMRPNSALGSDGARNFYHALILATCPKSAKNGVLIALNDLILSARDVIKSHTLAVNAFECGYIGYMLEHTPQFLYKLRQIHTYKTPFSLEQLCAPLPKVAILYGYQGDCVGDFAQVLKREYKGVVYAGLGAGNCSARALQTLSDLSEKIPVVISSRIQHGAVSGAVARRFITAGNVSAPKARILLQLALAHSFTHKEIAQIFRQI